MLQFFLHGGGDTVDECLDAQEAAVLLHLVEYEVLDVREIAHGKEFVVVFLAFLSEKSRAKMRIDEGDLLPVLLMLVGISAKLLADVIETFCIRKVIFQFAQGEFPAVRLYGKLDIEDTQHRFAEATQISEFFCLFCLRSVIRD